MTTYLSPGVYVKEVASGSAPIASVGTSTAAFIGILAGSETANTEPQTSPTTPLTFDKAPLKGSSNGQKKEFSFNIEPPFGDVKGGYKFFREADQPDGSPIPIEVEPEKFSINDNIATVTFKKPIPSNKALLASYTPPAQKEDNPSTSSSYQLEQIQGEILGQGDGKKKEFQLSRYPVDTTKENFSVTVQDDDASSNASIELDDQQKTAKLVFKAAPATGKEISIDYYPVSVTAGTIVLCTNFSEFKKAFGDFSKDKGRSNLAHAVFGFFRNGGTRCFVTWVTDDSKVDSVLEDFAAIDEIAIVAAPGVTDENVLASITAHCDGLGDRVAIFDSSEDVLDLTKLKPGDEKLPGASNYAAFYFPWIQVFDPATKLDKYVPPSGHMAGIYARVDSQRGVHKAPANEVVLGATGVKMALTRAKQNGLNPQGVNCIRNLNGNITVWGARTWGGDIHGEFKYINIRRLFNQIKESIDEGTQWVVFEPNSPELWAKIRRNISAYLTIVWRSGALFGTTPEEAFFVQCDAETNPPEVRNAGQVITKVGIAVVKPAEFVVFELSQWAGPGGN